MGQWGAGCPPSVSAISMLEAFVVAPPLVVRPPFSAPSPPPLSPVNPPDTILPPFLYTFTPSHLHTLTRTHHRLRSSTEPSLHRLPAHVKLAPMYRRNAVDYWCGVGSSHTRIDYWGWVLRGGRTEPGWGVRLGGGGSCLTRWSLNVGSTARDLSASQLSFTKTPQPT